MDIDTGIGIRADTLVEIAAGILIDTEPNMLGLNTLVDTGFDMVVDKAVDMKIDWVELSGHEFQLHLAQRAHPPHEVPLSVVRYGCLRFGLHARYPSNG